MTLAQFVTRCRRYHNADSDTFFSDDEIYGYLTDRCNEALSIIGLIEGTATDTSVASTQAYNYPSNTSVIRQVSYKGERLKRINFRKWELFRTQSGTTSGTPTHWVPWNRQILLVPIPDTSSDTITIYYYGEHPEIDGSSQATIDIPSVLHAHLVPGVVGDMFAKDLNTNMTQFYENKWNNVSLPAFYKFKSLEDHGTGFTVIGDCDTEDITGVGVT